MSESADQLYQESARLTAQAADALNGHDPGEHTHYWGLARQAAADAEYEEIASAARARNAVLTDKPTS